jgi:hypothetical protein
MSIERPRIVLTTMARNEERIIGNMIQSCAGIVDHVCLMDTGSDDCTGTEAALAAEAIGVPLTWFGRKWVDFGANRTELVKHAGGLGDWLLTLDCDHTLEVDVDAWAELQQAGGLQGDGYGLKILGAHEYWVPYLIRAGGPVSGWAWRYEGVTHEYLTSSSAFAPHPPLGALAVSHHCDGSRRPVKFEDDRALLEAEYARDPSARTTFYLAQTVRDLGDRARAIELYAERAAMIGTWEEERWYAAYQAAALANDTPRLLDVWHERPQRLEPLLAAVQLLRHGRPDLAAALTASGLEQPLPVNDVLFIDTTARPALEALAAVPAGR